MGNFIDSKYRGKGPVEDWVKTFIEDKCYIEVQPQDAEGKPIGKAQTRLDVDGLLDTAEANNLNVDSFRAQKDGKNAPGRIRMSVGSMLRAAAKRRHGLYDAEGKWHDAPEGFAEGEPTEDRSGKAIVKAKPAAEKAEEKADEKADAA